jgi:uncharacterized protein with HEPN domain
MSGAEVNALNLILDHMSSIEEALQGMGFQDYRNDRKTKIEVVEKFAEIIELAEKIAFEEKQRMMDFPWENFISLRNRFINHDHGLNVEEIWNTSKRELKTYRKMINEALYSASSSSSKSQ